MNTTQLQIAQLKGWGRIKWPGMIFFLTQKYPWAPSAPCCRSPGSGGTAWTCWHVSQSCGWPGACGSPFSYEKPAGPGQDWEPPLQIHSSLHSPLANRRGPTNHPAKPARKKPSLLATGTSATRQPEPEAPARPTEHREAVTPAKPGRVDSLNFICPSGAWNKIEKQTSCAVKLVILTTNKTGLVSTHLSQQLRLGIHVYAALLGPDTWSFWRQQLWIGSLWQLSLFH